MNRVLYLSYDGLTDPLGQSQVLPYLTGLSSSGYDITIISFEKEKRKSTDKKNIEETCHAHQINWQPLTYTKTPPVFSTLKDLYTLKRKIRTLQKTSPFSIVHCRSYITALAGLWMKKKWGTKFIFDMRGFWADERVEGGLWNLSNPLYRIIYWYFKKKEKKFLESADHIISLTENAAREIHSWKNIKGQPVPLSVIPCCVDIGLFDPSKISNSQINELKQKLNIDDGSKVITYVGSIGTWYMLEEMLDFFKRWLVKNPRSVFLFVTKDDPVKISNAAMKIGIGKNSIRIHTATRNQMPLVIATSDYSIFFIKPVFSKKASSPTKQGEIMAMGKPVICNSAVGDTEFIVNKYRSGVLVDHFSDMAYDHAISSVTDLQRFDALVIRRGAQEFYSLSEGIKKYQHVYSKLLNEKKD